MIFMAWVLIVFIFELGIFAICACVLGTRREREARVDIVTLKQRMDRTGGRCCMISDELLKLRARLDRASDASENASKPFNAVYFRLYAGTSCRPFWKLMFYIREAIYARAIKRHAEAYTAYRNAGGDYTEDDAA